MSELAGRVAIVTGASRGIGYALTAQLLGAGCRVAAWSRTQPKGLPNGLLCVPTDIAKPAEVKAAWQKTQHWAPQGIDFLINNAGIGTYGPVEKIDPKDWTQLFHTNMYGAFLCTRMLVPHMKERGKGHIIQVGSVAGLRATAYLSAYCATKFALRGFSEALMLELREHNIKVSYLAPGGVDTTFFETMKGFRPSPNLMQAEEVAATIIHMLQSSANYLPACVEVRPLRPQKS